MREYERARSVLPLVFLLAFIYLYFILFVPPWTPIATGIDDDKLFLYEATGILKGEVIYRDFFEFYFPGTQAFYALVILLVGPRAWIPNVCLVSLGIGFVWASIVLSRKLIGRAGMFLPGLIFLWVSFHSYLDASAHWYSNILIVAAAAVLADERSRTRLALAGGLCGLAVCFSQHHGLFAALGFGAFILWEGRADANGWRQISRREIHFMLPLLLVVAVFIGYIALWAGLDTVVSSTILFPLRYWNNGEANDWSEYILIQLGSEGLRHPYHWLRLAILALLVPGIYIVSIVSYIRAAASAPTESSRRIILLSIVGLATFASIANSASYWRLATVSLPAFVVALWMLDRKFGVKAAYVLWVVTILVMLRDIRSAQKNCGPFLNTPSGRIALSATTQEYEPFYTWLSNNTAPGQWVFDADGWQVYFWFGLRNPTKLLPLNSSGYATPEQVDDAVRDLERRQPRLILWDSELDWELSQQTNNPMRPLRTYLYAHYRKIKTFAESGGSDSVWERGDSH